MANQFYDDFFDENSCNIIILAPGSAAAEGVISVWPNVIEILDQLSLQKKWLFSKNSKFGQTELSL
jgi:hypothetical protein